MKIGEPCGRRSCNAVDGNRFVMLRVKCVVVVRVSILGDRRVGRMYDMTDS